MKFLTGDDTGLLKLVHVEAQKVERFGPRRQGDAVQRLCWAGAPGASDREEKVAVAFVSGVLELRASPSGQVLGTASIAGGTGGVVSLEALDQGLLAISPNGSASIVRKWTDSNAEAPQAPQAAPQAPKKRKKGKAKVDAKEEEDSGIQGFTLQGPVASACIDPCRPNRLAFGGAENDVKIFDLATQEVTWTARNVRDDYLSLRAPVKVSSLQWGTSMAPTRSLILCSTRTGKIRIYDANTQRKPLFEVTVGFGLGAGTGGYTGTMDDDARPINCSSIAKVRGDSWSLFVGDTLGILREYDLRKLPKSESAKVPPGRKSHMKLAAREMPFQRGYRGVMGSIRDLDVHCSGEAVVAVGLGRFAYVFDPRKKLVQSKVYLKQKLNCVLFSSEARAKPPSKEEQEEGEEEVGEDDEVEDGDITGAEEIDDREAPAGDEVAEGFSDEEAAEMKPSKKGARRRSSSSKGKKAKSGTSGVKRRKSS